MNQPISSQFLVCGLGSLGQQCVLALKAFGAIVRAIDQTRPSTWEITNLPDLLDRLTVGDCREPAVLEAAGIHECRAILLVASNERINIETAFAARLLNPEIRLVVRSTKQNLSDLLGKHLGNFVAFEPNQLPASAFALASLGDDVLGFFTLDHQLLRVVREKIQPDHRWCDRRQLQEINKRTCRVLGHEITDTEKQQPKPYFPSPNSKSSLSFYNWEPDDRIRAGDSIIYIEAPDNVSTVVEKAAVNERKNENFWTNLVRSLLWRNLSLKLQQLQKWIAEVQTRRVVVSSVILLSTLLLVGTILFRLNYPELSFQDAFYTTAVLLLGGYGDLFGQPRLTLPLPWWLRLFGLGLTLVGIAFVGVLYGLLTENLLSTRFEFLSRRPPLPQQDHVILIGLGRMGQRVAAVLQELKQPVVGIGNVEVNHNFLPDLPLVIGDLAESLTKVNLSQAKSAIAVTDDEMVNLELGMMVHTVNPKVGLAIRTFEQRFSDNLSQFLPYAQFLCAYSLSAEAFATAAYGENVLSLFRLHNQTVLVTEYIIAEDDTLAGLLLAEVAYGYGVVPILYQEAARDANPKNSRLMPSDDIRLKAEDRLVVLATVSSLQRIEQGAIATELRVWFVYIDRAVTREAKFEGANAIARVSGYSLSTARTLMESVPVKLDLPLYNHQALRLVRELSRAQVIAHIAPD